jgi:cation:H+ antiporter
MNFSSLSITVNILLFLLGVGIIAVFGVLMTQVARQLAHESGMGEAVMGAVFIGGSTSLSGIIASITAAGNGHAELAVSNSLGGIAAQTVFLAVADFFYRKVNLEHAAASVENLMMNAFLMTLLSILLVAFALPDYSLWAIHPATPLLILSYLFGVRVLASTHKMPMWLPRRTRDTSTEPHVNRRKRAHQLAPLWLKFAGCGLMVGISGWLLARTGTVITANTGLSEGIMGGVFIAISTSLPELVIAVTAVRMKALTLAVGDIVGGNAFDTLFVAMSDIAYRDGPIYSAITAVEMFWLGITLLMTGVLLMGLLYRERHGPANIGVESLLLIIIYAGGVLAVASM